MRYLLGCNKQITKGISLMKKWYKSKTILFNLLSMGLLGAEQSFSLLQPMLGESTYGVVLFIITMANIGLRTITTSAVVK